MIRLAEPKDTKAITGIYNEYVINSVVTFETEAVSVEEMSRCIAGISKGFPFLVYETDGEIAGYCYVHPWKEKAAYKYTLEVTVYLSPKHTGKGFGRELMLRIIDETRKNGYRVLIACITEGNEASISLYTSLGFKQVSHFEKVGFKFEKWLDVLDYQLML